MAKPEKPGLLAPGMAFDTEDSDPEKAPVPERSIFAVREVLLRGNLKINQDRGMACAVKVEGKKYLLTYTGVINEEDQTKPIKFFDNQQDSRLELSAITQTGTCSFISLKSVERGEDAHTPTKDFKTYNSLEVKVPESDEKTNDVSAYSFVGCKDFVTIKFKYNDKVRAHELDSVEKPRKRWFKRETGEKFEKSAILGSPIITTKNHVIGVVGDDSYGQLCPYFVTKTEFGHEEIKNRSENGMVHDDDGMHGTGHEEIENPSENGTGVVQGKGTGCGSDTLDASGIAQEISNLKSIEKLKDAISKSEVESNRVPALTKELSDAVSDIGFFVSDNDGKGNCLFHALSEQLRTVKKKLIKPDELRETMVQYLKEHPEMKDGTPLSIHLESDEQGSCTWDKYLNDMARDGTWGDGIIIFAAANYFKTIINVIGKRLEISFKPECDVNGDDPIWLGHIYEFHFVSLLKAPEPPSDPPINRTRQEELKDKLGKFVSGVSRSCSQGNQISATKPTMEIVRTGQFPSGDLPYLACDLLNERNWERIATHLGVQIRSNDDESDEYERCYEMLETWTNKGTGASYKELASALTDLRMQTIRGNYCLEEHHPPPQETKATNAADMKQGVIDEKKFICIARHVQVQRYRLGRALGLKDSELRAIKEDHHRNIGEQSYQILKKWRSSVTSGDATYTTLAKALRNRTVSLEKVVEEFCLVGST